MHNGHDNGPQGAKPLNGLKVVDFSTLLPGPMASLILAEAGADVVKIERPVIGEDMRAYDPKLGGADSANFILLNRGKRSIGLDLKDPADNAVARALVAEADILIEQFRPGVMNRLGLSFEAMSAINPKLIYCSITGYGQSGERRNVAAHDLNYIADAGLLSLSADRDGKPSIPPIPIADIGGGAFPAVINILLALQERAITGRGRALDIAMTENVLPFLYWAMGNTLAGHPPVPGGELVSGGSPRYFIYRTRDGRFIAAAPIEDKFWRNFCGILGLSLDAGHDEVAAAIAGRDAADWEAAFAGKDVCCSIVRTMDEVLADPAFRERGVFDRLVDSDLGPVPALPVPLVAAYRSEALVVPAPALADGAAAGYDGAIAPSGRVDRGDSKAY